MSFWSRLFGFPNHAGIDPNLNPSTSVGEPGWTPGDPDGVIFDGWDPVEPRSLPVVLPSPWSGWPATWDVPRWDFGSRFNELIDVAWACLDLNAQALSTMPVYRTRSGRIVEPATWMVNPDPRIYTSWEEFAHQLFWDYQLGEAFVLSMSRFSDGYPMTFRVVPPWMIQVEMDGGARRYRLGNNGVDVTDDVLHIRYRSTSDGARGVGPLESAGGRMLTAGVLATYVRETVKVGGVPTHTLETDQELSDIDAQDLLNQWMTSRTQNLGAPPILDNNVTLKTHMAMSPKDMAMLEITQFTEGRIAVLLGVRPEMVALPTGDTETYKNVGQIFDFHDRSSLRPKARRVMSALSGWALPRGQAAELNRDEYSRPSFDERAQAWERLVKVGIVTADEVRVAERIAAQGETAADAMVELTGGEQ